MVHLTRSTCLFKENGSAKTTVVEEAPSGKKKKKKKKKTQKVQASNANDDDADASTAVGSPVLKLCALFYLVF